MTSFRRRLGIALAALLLAGCKPTSVNPLAPPKAGSKGASAHSGEVQIERLKVKEVDPQTLEAKDFRVTPRPDLGIVVVDFLPDEKTGVLAYSLCGIDKGTPCPVSPEQPKAFFDSRLIVQGEPGAYDVNIWSCRNVPKPKPAKDCNTPWSTKIQVEKATDPDATGRWFKRDRIKQGLRQAGEEAHETMLRLSQDPTITDENLRNALANSAAVGAAQTAGLVSRPEYIESRQEFERKVREGEGLQLTNNGLQTGFIAAAAVAGVATLIALFWVVPVIINKWKWGRTYQGYHVGAYAQPTGKLTAQVRQMNRMAMVMEDLARIVRVAQAREKMFLPNAESNPADFDKRIQNVTYGMMMKVDPESATESNLKGMLTQADFPNQDLGTVTYKQLKDRTLILRSEFDAEVEKPLKSSSGAIQRTQTFTANVRSYNMITILEMEAQVERLQAAMNATGDMKSRVAGLQPWESRAILAANNPQDALELLNARSQAAYKGALEMDPRAAQAIATSRLNRAFNVIANYAAVIGAVLTIVAVIVAATALADGTKEPSPVEKALMPLSERINKLHEQLAELEPVDGLGESL